MIIYPYNQNVSDSRIASMLGKAKTGILFRIKGTPQPYIKLPAQFCAGFGETS